MSFTQAVRNIADIGNRLRTIADFPGKWSVANAFRVVHPTLNDDHNPVYSGDARMLFKASDMQVFFDNLDKIEALQNRELKIMLMREESPEFDELMKVVDFTIDMAD